MDDTDRRLIALLRQNARLPVATLAELLKVSRGTVQNRIDRLTDDGVISGFTVRLRRPNPWLRCCREDDSSPNRPSRRPNRLRRRPRRRAQRSDFVLELIQRAQPRCRSR
jgi:predicted ArsR family transcriptional regulator